MKLTQMQKLIHYIFILHCVLHQYGIILVHSLQSQSVDSNDNYGSSNIKHEQEQEDKMNDDNSRNHRERKLLYNDGRRVQSSSSSNWQGCVDPNNPNTEDNLVSVGKRTTICIVVSQGGNWGNGNYYSRWVFQPTADEYSHFVIDSSYSSLVKNPSNFYYPAISVHVESQQAWVFPYLTAIITVKNGVITGISWDDSCAFCDESRCVENTYDFSGKNVTQAANSIPSKSCYFTKAECDNLVANGEKTCTLGIYFVWTGTDKDNKVLNSFKSRMGAFPPNRIPKIEKYLPKFNIPVFGS